MTSAVILSTMSGNYAIEKLSLISSLRLQVVLVYRVRRRFWRVLSMSFNTQNGVASVIPRQWCTVSSSTQRCSECEQLVIINDAIRHALTLNITLLDSLRSPSPSWFPWMHRMESEGKIQMEKVEGSVTMKMDEMSGALAKVDTKLTSTAADEEAKETLTMWLTFCCTTRHWARTSKCSCTSTKPVA